MKIRAIAILMAMAIGTNANILSIFTEPIKAVWSVGLQIGSEPNNTAPLPSNPKITSCCYASSPEPCVKSPYRTIDGYCNNLKHPDWGTPMKPYCRLLDRKFCNVSRSGKPLPNARMLSKLFFPNKIVDDKLWTVATMVWGQLVAHILSLTFGVPQTASAPFSCCQDGQYTKEAQTNPQCAPVPILSNDSRYPTEQCMDFVKTLTVKNVCKNSSENLDEPISETGSYLDGSIIYGQNGTHATSLRSGQHGYLQTITRNGQKYPLQDPNPQAACFVNSSNEACFYSGDIRINQHPVLALYHINLLLLHNTIADEFSRINPHWDDERTYQEARRLVIALFQCITYEEYLEAILGKKYLDKSMLKNPGHYNPDVNTCVTTEFATSSFRVFHSSIPGFFSMNPENKEESFQLSEWMLKPSVIDNKFNEITKASCTQPQRVVSMISDREISDLLFRGPSALGLDLHAMDIERGRDHCLGSYNDAREFCGLSRAKTFEDFLDYISKEDVEKLRSSYETPEDVELSIGAHSEKPSNGGLIGPTHKCIIAEQFRRTRLGDRYFYDTKDKDIAFSPEQSKSIRESCSLASLLCMATPDIKSIQTRAFEKVSLLNLRVSCSLIPKVDLNLWKEKK